MVASRYAPPKKHKRTVRVFLNGAICHAPPPSQHVGGGRAYAARDVLVGRNYRTLSMRCQPQISRLFSLERCDCEIDSATASLSRALTLPCQRPTTAASFRLSREDPLHHRAVRQEGTNDKVGIYDLQSPS